MWAPFSSPGNWGSLAWAGGMGCGGRGKGSSALAGLEGCLLGLRAGPVGCRGLKPCGHCGHHGGGPAFGHGHGRPLAARAEQQQVSCAISQTNRGLGQDGSAWTSAAECPR